MESVLLIFYAGLFFLLLIYLGKSIHKDKIRRERLQRLSEMKIVIDNINKYRRNKGDKNE
jgi:hypothetical protein